MKLSRATFLGIRGLPDVTFDLTSPDTGRPHPVVVLTGPPESGKTRALEAILAAKDVLAPYDVAPEDGEGWVRGGRDAAKVELTFALDALEQRRYGLPERALAEVIFTPDEVAADADQGLVALLAEYDHTPKNGKVDYFAARRGLARHVQTSFTADDQRPHRTTGGPSKYAFVPAYLASLANDDAAARRFQGMLSRLCPRLAYARPKSGDPTRCIAAHGRAPAHPQELSSTEVDAVLWAATASLVRFDRSLVLVDRPELSSDEASFATWLQAARDLAEDLQLILASASPAVIASVDESAVLRLRA
ncbi:MAG: hypothetical protein IPG04_07010 [Polyangiaceae bacterium]|jgi:hypothetical protein|nr:hypothetical protein [Polyangiaceae bacterium]